MLCGLRMLLGQGMVFNSKCLKSWDLNTSCDFGRVIILQQVHVKCLCYTAWPKGIQKCLRKQGLLEGVRGLRRG